MRRTAFFMTVSLSLTFACSSASTADRTSKVLLTDAAPPVLIGPESRQAQLLAADTSSGPRPMLLVLHGYAMDAASMKEFVHLGTAARELNMHAVVPEGRFNAESKRYWDATDACCDAESGAGYGTTDKDYLLGLVEAAERAVTVDHERIYLVGFSNGSFMAQRLACERADLFAGVASFSGANFLDSALCKPSRPLNMIHLHGTIDPVIKYDGGVLVKGAYPSATATVDFWAKQSNCQSKKAKLGAKDLSDFAIDLSQFPGQPTLEQVLATSYPGNETDVLDYSDCDAGRRVALWTMNGLGHAPLFHEDILIEVLRTLAQ